MKRKRYPSDVTDQQWALIEPFFPRSPRRPGPGRPQEVDLREVVNALFYHAREGCSWRALPHDFPAWNSVYHYFREWCAGGTSRALRWSSQMPSTTITNCTAGCPATGGPTAWRS